MKRVFRSASIVDVAHFRNVLELRGIPVHVRNFHLGGALGELPWLDVMPELWVVDERDAPLAERLIAEGGAPAPSGARDAWSCEACGERLEGQFTECWHCGAARVPA